MEHSQVHREHGQIFFSSIWWAHKLFLARDHSFPLDKLLVLWPKEVICWNFLHRSNFYFSYENSTYKKQNISLLFEIISCTSLSISTYFIYRALLNFRGPKQLTTVLKNICFYNQHSLDSKYSGDSNHQGIHEQLPGKDGAHVPFLQVNCLLLLLCITAVVSQAELLQPLPRDFILPGRIEGAINCMPTVYFSSTETLAGSSTGK